MTKVIEKSQIHIKDMSDDSIKEALNEHVAKIVKGVKAYSIEFLKITSHMEVLSTKEVSMILDIEARTKK